VKYSSLSLDEVGVKFDRYMSQRSLVDGIRRFGRQSMEARQVSTRLRQLLPNRFIELKNKFRRQFSKIAECERRALVDPAYLQHISELNDMRYQALEGRISYETHVMLYQARQTIQRMHRP